MTFSADAICLWRTKFRYSLLHIESVYQVPHEKKIRDTPKRIVKDQYPFEESLEELGTRNALPAFGLLEHLLEELDRRSGEIHSHTLGAEQKEASPENPGSLWVKNNSYASANSPAYAFQIQSLVSQIRGMMSANSGVTKTPLGEMFEIHPNSSSDLLLYGFLLGRQAIRMEVTEHTEKIKGGRSPSFNDEDAINFLKMFEEERKTHIEHCNRTGTRFLEKSVKAQVAEKQNIGVRGLEKKLARARMNVSGKIRTN